MVEGTATRSAVWHPHVSNGLGASLQVGDTVFTAVFLAKFLPEAALPDTYQIDSMVYVLRRNRIWPYTGAAPLSIQVRQVRQYWSEDSLFADAYIDSFARRDTLPVAGNFTMQPLDTSYAYTIPPSIWEEWVELDSLNNGLLFEPLSAGTMVEFYSAEAAADYRSMVQMYVSRTDDSTVTDTIELLPTADAYFAVDNDSTKGQAPERLVLCQGFPQRGAIYFPLDTLSRVFDRQVNRAQLFLHAIEPDPDNMNYPGQILGFKDGTLLDTLWFDNPDSTHLNLVAVESGSYDSTGTTIVFNVNSSVASWVAVSERNAGFQVQSSLETGFLGRQVFYGTGPGVPDSLKPRLVIWYTEVAQ